MVQQRSAVRKEAPSTPTGERRAGGKSSYASNQADLKTRGGLQKGYEGRFSSPTCLSQDDTHYPVSARSNRGAGVSKFTDPTNPFNRALSKHMSRIEDSRNENDRAGARTRNPAMIPRTDQGGSSERAASEDARGSFCAHQYSTTGDWRPAKRCPDFPPAASEHSAGPPSGNHAAQSPRCSAGFTSCLPEGPQQRSSRPSFLENYLNDMKRCSKSLRSVNGAPSPNLQRMNTERVKLPAERRLERERGSAGSAIFPSSESCKQLPSGSLETVFMNEAVLGGVRPESARIRRSFSCDPRIQRSAAQGEIYDREDNYGFSRKREVSADWARNRGSNILHHAAGHDDPPSTPRRAERLMQKADQRFVEVVAHMKSANPEQKLHFETFKARGAVDLLAHDPTPRQM